VIRLQIPGRGAIVVEHLVLDVNGTIASGGEVVPGVAERLAELGKKVEVHLITADTRGRQDIIDAQLGIRAVRTEPGNAADQKAGYVRSLGSDGVCAVGNGAIDAQMLDLAGLAIAVLGEEGLAVSALTASDMVVPHINAALDLLLDPPRIAGTLRK
jgi:soluble P-type ATPase